MTRVAEALFAAVRSGDFPRLQSLLGRGAPPDASDDDDITLLHWAAWHARPDIVGLLIEHGADVNARDRQGRSPLHWAARSGDPTTALHLLSHGASARLADHLGHTPLHWATLYGHARLFAALTEHERQCPPHDEFPRPRVP